MKIIFRKTPIIVINVALSGSLHSALILVYLSWKNMVSNNKAFCNMENVQPTMVV